MFDFCFTFPYASLLALGGLAGFAAKGSTASLAGGVGSAAVLALCGSISLKFYHQGKLCKPATFVSLLVAVALTGMMYKRYSVSWKLMPSGMVFYLSTAMSVFYVWNLFFGPRPQGKTA